MGYVFSGIGIIMIIPQPVGHRTKPKAVTANFSSDQLPHRSLYIIVGFFQTLIYHVYTVKGLRV